MANHIVWKKSSELIDLSELLASKQDFTIHGIVEQISKDETSLRVKLVEKDKVWHGIWFSFTEEFDLESLKKIDWTKELIEFTAKIETFYGKDDLLKTKVTFTNWLVALGVEHKEADPLTIKDAIITEIRSTDQNGLSLLTFKRENEKGEENYHVRYYSKTPWHIGSHKKDILFRLSLTKHQLNRDGVRMVGIEHYEYEKDGETVSGERQLFRLCLELLPESVEEIKNG